MIYINIETDNDAFADSNLGPEVARILRKLAGQIEADPYQDGRRLMDVNGNRVGDMSIRFPIDEGARFVGLLEETRELLADHLPTLPSAVSLDERIEDYLKRGGS